MNPTYVRPNIRITRTKLVPRPSEYVLAIQGEFKDWAFDEERAPKFKGVWRSEVFQSEEAQPVDLEIGTGNGFHFAHQAQQSPERKLIGIELKYKPLIQSIRRAVEGEELNNARMVRYNARLIEDLFAEGELNNVYVHFPDPYLKNRLRKRRLLTPGFLEKLHALQRSGSRLEFKTDSEDYFDWALEHFKTSRYQLDFVTRDLHRSEKAEENFLTAFEKIFSGQGLPIYSAHLVKK